VCVLFQAALGYSLVALPPLVLFFTWDPRAVNANDDDDGTRSSSAAFGEIASGGGGSGSGSGGGGGDDDSGGQRGSLALGASADIGKVLILGVYALAGPLAGWLADTFAAGEPDGDGSPLRSDGGARAPRPYLALPAGGAGSANRGGGGGGGGGVEVLSPSGEGRRAGPVVCAALASLASLGAYNGARRTGRVAILLAVSAASGASLGAASALWPALVADLFGCDALLDHLGKEAHTECMH